MNIAGHDIGVCSWSLRPKDLEDLVAQVKQLGLSHVQLALGPLLTLDDKRKHQQLGHLRNAGFTLTAGMIAFPGADPREFWQRAEDRNRATAQTYDKLGLAEYEAIEGFARWDGSTEYL